MKATFHQIQGINFPYVINNRSLIKQSFVQKRTIANTLDGVLVRIVSSITKIEPDIIKIGRK